MSDDANRSEAGQKNLWNLNKPLVEDPKRTIKVLRASKKKSRERKKNKKRSKKVQQR